jgi:hypothetical protein
MRRLLKSINVRRSESAPSVFDWPSDEPPVIHAGSLIGILMVNATDDMDVDDLREFVRDNRRLFPEKTSLLVYAQSAQSATIAINAIESMAPFRGISINPSWRLDSRWKKDTPNDLTNIKTDVPIHWGANGPYPAHPIFDPCKVRDLDIGPAQLVPSSNEIRLRRLTIDDPKEITGLHIVKPHLLSLKINRNLTDATQVFKGFSSLKVLDLKRGSAPRSSRLPVIVPPPSLDTLKLTGFKRGVVIRGKVNHAKLMPNFKGINGEYQFATSPDFIWVTTNTVGYSGAYIWGNIDDYKVVAGEGWKLVSDTHDQIQTSSAAFFAAKVR